MYMFMYMQNYTMTVYICIDMFVISMHNLFGFTEYGAPMSARCVHSSPPSNSVQRVWRVPEL